MMFLLFTADQHFLVPSNFAQECKEIEGCGSCEFDGKYYKKGESF